MESHILTFEDFREWIERLRRVAERTEPFIFTFVCPIKLSEQQEKDFIEECKRRWFPEMKIIYSEKLK